MTSALAPLDDRMPIADQIKAARAAGIIPATVKGDDAAIGIALKARELGVPIMAAYASIHVINGRPTCSAQLMLACARRHVPDLLYEVESGPDKCEGRMSANGGKTWFRLAWTWKMAQDAGLTGKDNWKKFPATMLRWRVIADLVRLAVPEATLGVYTRDEVEDGRTPVLRTHAQEVQAKLLGEPGPVAVDPAEVAELPQETDARMAFEDWSLALEQAGSWEEWDGHCRKIADDGRLTDQDRAALKSIAFEKVKRESWKKPA